VSDNSIWGSLLAIAFLWVRYPPRIAVFFHFWVILLLSALLDEATVHEQLREVPALLRTARCVIL
jgi:hypothetical protein